MPCRLDPLPGLAQWSEMTQACRSRAYAFMVGTVLCLSQHSSKPACTDKCVRGHTGACICKCWQRRIRDRTWNTEHMLVRRRVVKFLALARAWPDTRSPLAQAVTGCGCRVSRGHPAGLPIPRPLRRKSTRTTSARSSRHVSEHRATFLSVIDELGFHALSRAP
jgi:hypothetical protein